MNTAQVVIVTDTNASDWLSPYMLGVQDAEQGLACTPEMYFVRQGQMREYAEGHEAVAGRTPASDQILGRVRALTQDELDDYDALARAYFAMDDSAPTLGLVFGDEDEGSIEDDHSWIRGGC